MFDNFIISLFLGWVFLSFLGSLNIELNQNSNVYISNKLITEQCFKNNQTELIYFICTNNKLYLSSCNKVNVDCDIFL